MWTGRGWGQRGHWLRRGGVLGVEGMEGAGCRLWARADRSGQWSGKLGERIRAFGLSGLRAFGRQSPLGPYRPGGRTPGLIYQRADSSKHGSTEARKHRSTDACQPTERLYSAPEPAVPGPGPAPFPAPTPSSATRTVPIPRS